MLSASILLSKGIFQVILLVCFHERKELLTSLFLPIVLFSQILLITHISQKKKKSHLGFRGQKELLVGETCFIISSQCRTEGGD